ncbi:MAG: thioredoxin family protein [Nitrospirota bacterium]|nr:thioredoxin family protein [Nitrospirota bacterium]
MLRDNTLKLIRDALVGMKNPVRLVLFTGETNCDECHSARELASAIKAASGKIALEVYDIVMDRDKTTEYGVKRTPSFVVQCAGGRTVSFSGSMEGVSLLLLLEALTAGSTDREWFPSQISGTLAFLEKGVSVKVLLENECSLCMPVAQTAVGLALTNRLVSTEIIVADEYPELLSKHKVRILPYTLFGEALHLEGHVPESEFLEKIFQAEGQKASGLDRLCLVCGSQSPDIICGSCKTKIQAEAVNHKRKDERLQEKGMAIDSHQHGR